MNRGEINSALRESGCLDSENFTLMCFTFNCGGNDPDFSANALFDEIGKLNQMPELICVGLQEMVALNAQNVLAKGFSEQQGHKWLQVILRRLNDYEEKYNPYEVVAHECLVGLWICLISTRKLKTSLKEVSVGHCATGIGGVLGNKGGVAVRFQMLDSTVCIVNSHLAAHRESFVKRNKDFHEILYSGMFPDPYYKSMQLEKPLLSAEALQLQDKLKKITRKIEEHELTFGLDDDLGPGGGLGVEALFEKDNNQFSSESISARMKEREADWMEEDKSGTKRSGIRLSQVKAGASATVGASGRLLSIPPAPVKEGGRGGGEQGGLSVYCLRSDRLGRPPGGRG